MPLALAVPFPLVGTLISLPNGWARGLGSVGTATTAYVDDWASITIATGPMVSSVGSIALYIVIAQEFGRFTDGIDPNSTTNQATLIGSATQANLVQRIGSLQGGLLANTRYSFNDFSVKSVLGGTPPFWAPLVWNLSGDYLSSSVSPYASHAVQT